MALVTLWENIIKLPTEQWAFILSFVNKLIENNQDVFALENLIEKLRQTPSLFNVLENECRNPPYPILQTINTWLDTNDFATHYKAFSMKPYGERRLDFAFQSKEVATQKALFQGIAEGLFTEEWANDLEQQLKANRQKNLLALRNEFTTLRASSDPLINQQKLSLLCLCIETLARTTAQFDDKTPPSLISQELNTTQIMALYAMLTNPCSKLISEIGTGEGKSRISMILAACQVAQGKTVDFMTSDMPLAERDYLTYKAFFTSLNIRTSLITLNTPKQLYQYGGINFTDNSQLVLLRNRSDIIQEPFAFLALI